MFNKSAIMRAAWKTYNRDYKWRGAFNPTMFARCLGIAWAYAKAEAKPLTPAEAIRQQIEQLQYKSSRINIVPMQRALEAQYSAMCA